MNWKFTLAGKHVKTFLFVFTYVLITLFSKNSYGQVKNYATVQPETGLSAYYSLLGGLGGVGVNTNPGSGAGSVLNAGNAAIGDDSFATLNAKNFNLLLVGSAEGEAKLQLKFPANIQPGTTTYIKFDAPTATGLTVDLLNLVGDLTGLFNSSIVKLEAYSGATATLPGTLINAGNIRTAVVRDPGGATYFAVTSNVAYNSVAVKLRNPGNLLTINLGGSITMNVHNAFTYTPDNCNSAIFSDVGSSEGINVSLTTSLFNPTNAIDNNNSTYSLLQPGLVGVGASVSQTIFFNGTASANNYAKLVLSLPGSVLDVNLLSTIYVTAYNGNTPVGGARSVTSLLNLDLLGLFTNTRLVPFYFSPGAPFDRIRITLDNTVAIGGNILSGGVRIHEVQKTVSKPEIAGSINGALQSCAGSPLTLSVTDASADYTYNWYRGLPDGTSEQVASQTAGTYSPAALTPGNYTYFATRTLVGCLGESDSAKVAVTVNPAVLLSANTLTNATIGSAFSKPIQPATGGTPTFTYALATGSTLPAGLTVSPTGILSGMPTEAGNYSFGITATDALGCQATATYALSVQPALVLPPAVLVDGITNVAYPTQTIPVATGGTTPYTYTASDLPPGLVFNPTTREISGTPTTSGIYPVPVTVSDGTGISITTIYTITIKDPLAFAAVPLVNGVVGVPYNTQFLPEATGGTGPYIYSAVNLPPGLTFNPTTRSLSGTPLAAGNYTIPITVTDQNDLTITTNFNVIVTAPLSFASGTLPTGIVNTPYLDQIIPSATGGVLDYVYLAGILPPGLSFNPETRVISGTPTQPGNYSISIRVTDNSGSNVTASYTLFIDGGQLTLPTAVLPSGTVDIPYPSQTLPAASGGIGTYTYVQNNLPPGLDFNPATRELTGTPTLGGTSSFSIQASDEDGNQTVTNYTIVVNVNSPVVAAVTICSGSTATLTVQNVQPSVTYNWYASTGNEPVASGTSFNTPVLNSSTTYYVEGSSGTAVSQRVAVAVDVTPAPAPPVVVTNGITINSGQSATLQATTTNGNTINWYANPTGGAPLATGPSYTTPILTEDATFYVGTTNNATNCNSLTRVAVLVNVETATANPNCNAASGQQTGIEGLCLLCSVQGALNSTDDNPDNFTKINLGVGVGATGYQRLIFANAGIATDSIRLDLETPTGLLDLSVLGGIRITVLNGPAIVSTFLLNSSVLDLKLLGSNRFLATFVAGGSFDRVEVRFGALVSALSNLSIYGAKIIFPKPTVTAGNQTICYNSSATLTATPNGGADISWFALPTGGVALSSENSFTTPSLTATTTYYIQVSRAGCANEERIPVTVTVTPLQSTPVLATIAPICSETSTVLSVSNPLPGSVYNWFTTPNGGASIFTGTNFTTPNLSVNTTYYVEVNNGECVSESRGVASVVLNPRVALPQVDAAVSTINPGQTAVINASSTDSNVEFRWYTSSTATTPIFTGPTFVTPALFTTTTYHVEAFSAATGCSSLGRIQVTITVNEDVNPDLVACEAPVSQTTGVDGVLSVLTTVANPTLAIDNDKRTGSTLLMPVGLLSSVFQRVQFTAVSNVGDTVRMRLSSGGRLLSAALLGGVSITTYNNGVSNDDAINVNDPLIQLQLLAGGTEAQIEFVPSTPFNGVEVRLRSGVLSALTSVNFNYAQRILRAPTVETSNATACVNTSATLTVANPFPDIIYNWYDAAGNFLASGTSFETPAIIETTTFFVEATRAGCASVRIPVEVTLTPAPAAPVLLSNAVVTCSGSDLLLQVQNPITGITYQWFKDGVLIPNENAATLSVTGVTANATYAVNSVNVCGTLSATQASVVVTVGTLDVPIITPAAVTINNNERAILTASALTAGLVFDWYNVDPTTSGATPISSAENGQNGTFTTPLLSATTTFYVIARDPAIGGCSSAAQTVVVTVLPAGPVVSVPCEAATGQENGVGGVLAVLAGVDNANLVFDNNINSGSSLIIPVGIGSFVYQRAIFEGGSYTGDKVRLRLISPNKLLSLSVLPSITITTYNGTTSNNDAINLTNPLLSVQLLGGGEEATIEFTPTSVFDRVEVRLNSGLLGALTSLNFNYAQRIIAAPLVNEPTASACVGGAAVLGVSNPQTDGTITYKWYNGEDYLEGKDGATLNTGPILAAGVYTYSVTATRNGCESAKTLVTVTVLAAPLPPIASAGNPATTCINTEVVLSVDPIAGITYNLYSAAVGGTLLVSNNNSYTVQAGLPVGTYSAYAEAVNENGCVSATRTRLTVTITASGAAADVVLANQAVCEGSTVTLTPTSTVENPVFTFYTNADKTGLITSGVTGNGVLTLNGLAPGVSTYYIAVSGEGVCENAAGTLKAVTVTVNRSALAADVLLAGQEVCEGSPVTLAPTSTIANPVFTFYTNPDKTGLITAGLDAGTLTISNLTPGTYTYYVGVSGAGVCENAAGALRSVSVVVNRSGLAADIIIADQVVCEESAVTLVPTSTIENPIFTFYANADKTGLITTGVTGNGVLNLNGLAPGTYTYYIAVTGIGVCENAAGALKAVTVIINRSALAADVVLEDQTVCEGSAVTLAPTTTIENPVFTFYANADKTGLITTGVTGGVLTLNGLAPGTYTYYVAVSSAGVCENAAGTLNAVTVTVNRLALAADVVLEDQTVCEGSPVTLTPTTTIENPVFTFYANADKTGLITAGVTGGVLTLNGLAPGTYTYYVAVTGSGVCENAAGELQAVTVIINRTALAADIVLEDQTVCEGSAVTLTPTSTIENPVFTFYANADRTGLITAGVTGGVLTLNGLAPGTYTYYVAVSGAGVCENAAGTLQAVTVIVNRSALAADVVLEDQIVCEGSTVTLAPTSTVESPVFTFYANADRTGLITTGVSGGVLTLNGLAPGTYTYYVAVSGAGVCENAAGALHAVTVVVNRSALAADIILEDQTICEGSSVTLAPTSTIENQVFTFYANADKTGLITAGVDAGTLTLANLAPGTYTYYVAVSGAGVCENAAGALQAVTVIVNRSALAADVVLEDQTVCEGSTVTLAPTSTVENPVFTFYANADRTGLITTGVSGGVLTLNGLAPGTYTYYVAVSGAGVCENAAGALQAVTVIINRSALAADVVLEDQTVCEGSSVTLAPTSTIENPVFTFYANADKTGLITAGVDAGTLTLSNLAPGTYTYYVAVSGAGVCENAAGALQAVTVIVNRSALAADVILEDQAVCEGSSVTLTPTSTIENPVFTFYANADKTGLITTGVTGNGVLTLSGLAPGTYTYYVAVSGAGVCESGNGALQAVTVIVNRSALAADVVLEDQTVCEGSAVTLTPTSTIENPVFTFYANADRTGLITTGVTGNGVLTLSGLSAGTYTYYVAVSGAGVCENAAGALQAVTVVVNRTALAADIVIEDQTVCEGSSVMLAPTSAIENPVFTFYENADRTGLITTGVTGGVLTLNGLAPGTYTYYVAVSGAGICENAAGALQAVTVVVNRSALAADVVLADQTVCEGSAVTLAPTSTIENPVFTFYANADKTGLITTGVTGGVLTLNGLAPGIYTYYVAVSGAGVCENAAGALQAVTVVVNRSALAADIALEDQTVCEGTTVTLAPTSTIENPVFTFYANADKTGLITTGVTGNGVLTLTGLTAGTYTYYVAVSGAGLCENVAGALQAVTVVVNRSALAADIAIEDQAVCEGSTVTLAPTSTIENPVFTFYANADKTGIITTGVSGNGVLTLNGLTAGTYTYYVAVSGAGVCENAAGALQAVTVVVNRSALAADINLADQVVCEGSAVTLVPTSTIENPVFTFYTNADKTGAITTGVTGNGVLTLSGLAPGTYTYYVALSGTGVCESAAGALQAVTVVVNGSALATDINLADQAVCEGSAVTLSPTSTIENPVFTFYTNANKTGLITTGVTGNGVLTLINLTPGTYTYYVAVSGSGVCESTAGNLKAVTVIINAAPLTPAIANTGLTICSGETTVLSILNPQAGTIYQWYTAETGGALVFTGEVFTTPVLNATTRYYVQASNSSGCGTTGARLAITVTVNPRPETPVVAAANVSVCNGATAVLSVSNAQTGIAYNWFTTPTGGTSIATGANFTTGPISTETTYYVEAASTTCSSAIRAQVTVTPVPAPAAPVNATVTNSSPCVGTTAEIAIVNPDPALTYRWYAAQTGGAVLFTGTTYTTAALTATTTFYVESVSTTGCNSPTRLAVVVNVLPVLATPNVEVQAKSSSSITFGWASVTGAVSYEVSTDGGFTWRTPSSGVSGTTHVINGLKPLLEVAIQVRALGSASCQTSAAGKLTGLAENPIGNDFFVPNTFTPNGDGRNDVFYVYGNTVAQMKLRVYNQWGQFLYESLNIQNGWDGTYKGEIQPNGVYVYYLQVTFTDGKTAMKKGTITLLR